MLAKIKNHPDLVRDMRAGAIINKNTSAFENAKKQKEYILNMRNRLNQVESETLNLRRDILELKQLMLSR